MYISKESQLNSLYNEVLPKFIENTLIEGEFESALGHKLHYRYCIPSQCKAWVFLLQGRAESVEKYAELIFENYENGYAVFAFDHVGQGHSSRLTDNPMRGFISDFTIYVEDAFALCKVMQGIKEKAGQGALKQYLWCHSMGAAIGALLCEAHQGLFSKAVFCAPMFGIQAPIPMFIAKCLLSLGMVLSKLHGKPSSYFIGQGDYKELAFEQNHLTSSQARYTWFKHYYRTHSEACIGGVSYQWLSAALKAMDAIAAHAHKLHLPCLILKAGADQVVDSQAIDEVYKKIPDAQLFELPGSQHEILFERDMYREPALRRIFEFLSE